MSFPSPLPSGKTASLLLIAGAAAFPCLHAQDFSRQVALADRYFETGIIPEGLLSLLDPTMEGTLKGQFGLSVSLTAMYDSNVNLNGGRGGGPGFRSSGEDDIIFSINPNIFYTSDPEGGARHVITASYNPSYQIYLENSSLGRFNQNGGMSYVFNGAKLRLSAFLNLSQDSGADRFTGGYSEGSVLSAGLSANYQVAPRTSLNASLSSSFLSYSTAGSQDSDYISTNLGMSWAATELLSIGPSIRYRWADSITTGTEHNFAFLLNASYKSTDLTSLSASVGVESTDNSRQGGSGSELRFTGSLSFNYNFDPLWNWSGGISYANIPSPTTFGYSINDLNFFTSLSRSLDYGSISASISYSLSDAQQVGPAGAAPGTVPGGDDYFSISLGYSRPIGVNGTSFFSSVNYSDSGPWDRWTMSVGLSRAF